MKIRQIRYLLDEIEENTDRLEAGSRVWSEGADECAMADCDPSIQYELSNEIDRLWYEVKQLVNSTHDAS
jgi:hypothetical protein